jgi:hypothetical protein
MALAAPLRDCQFDTRLSVCPLMALAAPLRDCQFDTGLSVRLSMALVLLRRIASPTPDWGA